MKNLIRIITIFTIGYFSFMFFFSKKDSELKNQILEQLANTNENETFDLTQITNFEWEKLFMVYSDSGMRKSTIKKVIEINHYGIGDHTNRFYFINKGKLVKFFDCMHSTSSNIYMIGCKNEGYFKEVKYEDAKFKVRRVKYLSGLPYFGITANCK